MIALTHLILGLAMAYLLDKRLITTSVFAVVPDFDKTFNFLYPFVSNGILHSLLAAFIFSLLVFIYSENIESTKSSLIGYLSHLGIDSLCQPGVLLFFPYFSKISLGLATSTSFQWNLCIITISITAMFLKKNWESFRPFFSFQ